MGIDISDENMENLNLRYSNRHSNPHDEVLISHTKIYHWHKTKPIKDENEAKNYLRALITLCKEQKRTKARKLISLQDALHVPLKLEQELEKRYRVTTWIKKTLESWLVVFEATGEDSYEATRSSHFNYESDFAQKLARRTKSDKTWDYVKSVREKGFRKYQRSDFPGYEFVIEMKIITEGIRHETHNLLGTGLPIEQIRLLHALIGLYYPKNKYNTNQQRRWKNNTKDDIITRISEDFKNCSGLDISEKMVEIEAKKYANLKI
jgi:hypothetical protein